ncbi:MAG: hypothetical protein IK990_19075 [Ruminiclostridium sp.]|nr:hypothetical protein [Ruminiclostridium sp.]
MKKKIMIAALALLTAGMCSCGKTESPAVTATPQPTKSYQELNLPDVDWSDNGFNEAVNRYSEFTDTDIMGMASACAKGVAKSKGCTFDEAWDASYTVVSELVETGKQLKDMLVIGSATWGVPDKEKALTLSARFIELNNDVSGYISVSDTSVESEILAVMSEKASETTETEQEIFQEEPASIDWDDTVLIGNITAFAGYTDAKLAHATDVYRKGLAAASGLSEEEVSDEASNAVSSAKTNADIVVCMLPFRESWIPELEMAVSMYASDFIEFAEIFGEYAELASKSQPQSTSDSETEPMSTDPELSDENDSPSLSGNDIKDHISEETQNDLTDTR